MKNFKLRTLLVLAVLVLFGLEVKADKIDRLMNEAVCRNAVITQCNEHCSRYCAEKFDKDENKKCVRKNCGGSSGFCNLAVMGGDENLPGTLKAQINKGGIPKEFFVHLKDYKLCLEDPTKSPKAAGQQWSEGIEDALGE